MKVELIPINKLSVFKANPRFIKTDDFNDLKENIKTDPDFFRQRCCLVNKVGEVMTIYAGNQRYRAAVELGWKEIPCIVENDLAIEVMRKRSLLDNHNYGKWDTDILSNEWDMDELLSIGKSLLNNMKIPDLSGIEMDVFEKEEEEGKSEENGYIKYELVFNKEQQEKWHSFMKYLKEEFEGNTISERIITFITQNI